MIFPSWHRLVDLHEREIRALLAHGIPIKIQKTIVIEDGEFDPGSEDAQFLHSLGVKLPEDGDA